MQTDSLHGQKIRLKSRRIKVTLDAAELGSTFFHPAYIFIQQHFLPQNFSFRIMFASYPFISRRQQISSLHIKSGCAVIRAAQWSSRWRWIEEWLPQMCELLTMRIVLLVISQTGDILPGVSAAYCSATARARTQLLCTTSTASWYYSLLAKNNSGSKKKLLEKFKSLWEFLHRFRTPEADELQPGVTPV